MNTLTFLVKLLFGQKNRGVLTVTKNLIVVVADILFLFKNTVNKEKAK